MDLTSFSLFDGEIDDTVVLWRRRDGRRCLITKSYDEANRCLLRLLRLSRAGGWTRQSFASQLLNLDPPSGGGEAVRA